MVASEESLRVSRPHREGAARGLSRVVWVNPEQGFVGEPPYVEQGGYNNRCGPADPIPSDPLTVVEVF